MPHEWLVIGLAGIAWAIFNGGYVVWLSFGPKVLVEQGAAALPAASIISVGSWIMILSSAACGQIVNRFGHGQTILAIATGTALVALSLLAVPGAGLVASLLFGVIGMAPAGIIFALASKAVAPERRAFGMGVFFAIYYAIVSITPPLAGWIFDRTGSATGAIVFGACLFLLVLPTTVLFKLLRTAPRGMVLQEAA